jgi:hypothetical protein
VADYVQLFAETWGVVVSHVGIFGYVDGASASPTMSDRQVAYIVALRAALTARALGNVQIVCADQENWACAQAVDKDSPSYKGDDLLAAVGVLGNRGAPSGAERGAELRERRRLVVRHALERGDAVAVLAHGGGIGIARGEPRLDLVDAGEQVARHVRAVGEHPLLERAPVVDGRAGAVLVLRGPLGIEARHHLARLARGAGGQGAVELRAQLRADLGRARPVPLPVLEAVDALLGVVEPALREVFLEAIAELVGGDGLERRAKRGSGRRARRARLKQRHHARRHRLLRQTQRKVEVRRKHGCARHLAPVRPRAHARHARIEESVSLLGVHLPPLLLLFLLLVIILLSLLLLMLLLLLLVVASSDVPFFFFVFVFRVCCCC